MPLLNVTHSTADLDRRSQMATRLKFQCLRDFKHAPFNGIPTSRWALATRGLARVALSIGYVAGVGAHNALLAGPGAIIGVKVWP